MDTFKTNLVGPAFVAQSLIPLVEKSSKKTIVNVSSTVGSIGIDMFGKIAASYSVSKAALNMLVRRPHAAHHKHSGSTELMPWTPRRRTSRRRNAQTLPRYRSAPGTSRRVR